MGVIGSESGRQGHPDSPQHTPTGRKPGLVVSSLGSQNLRWGLGTLGIAVVLISLLVLGSYHTSAASGGVPAPVAPTSGVAGSAEEGPGGSGDGGQPAGEQSGTSESGEGAATVPQTGSGRVRVATFTRAAPADQQGRRVRVRVEVENEMPVDPEQVAAQAAGILQDKRSWSSKQRVSFDFVGGGTSDLVIRVLTPGTTDKRCYPLRTNSKVSCSTGSAVNLNGQRWVGGIPDYAGDLTGYRTYLVNHEVGHYLGLGHVNCPGPGQPAPVMMQQTYGLEGCARNPWP